MISALSRNCYPTLESFVGNINKIKPLNNVKSLTCHCYSSFYFFSLINLRGSYLHVSENKVQLPLIKPILTETRYEKTDPEQSQYYAYGFLWKETLLLRFYLKSPCGDRSQNISGEQEIGFIMEYFKNRFDEVLCVWDSESDNYKQFYQIRPKLVAEGCEDPDKQAALGTWSGKQLRRYSFSEILQVEFKDESEYYHGSHEGASEDKIDTSVIEVRFGRP